MIKTHVHSLFKSVNYRVVNQSVSMKDNHHLYIRENIFPISDYTGKKCLETKLVSRVIICEWFNGLRYIPWYSYLETHGLFHVHRTEMLDRSLKSDVHSGGVRTLDSGTCALFVLAVAVRKVVYVAIPYEQAKTKKGKKCSL